ncbi:TonB-linked outer membrane protein, SusC/RagA family [Zunongwangia mangrovi]|uniref:TonB-linked outer membrane protein, SusC/RagA family n=1 Tax=Zunongwangia mangrovi TaxID=1334022 RepID=A0A1I1L8U9_9FLAO|nr:SusC/RagA family TonB-linked outer membrane protein [Zunongwangia mangrovi]SFC66823.1 TonB-linked outer membrane protein, SusC/RagA family [Zunongwangia mangrovi]
MEKKYNFRILKILFVIITTSLFCDTISAQQVSGVVSDAKLGEPLLGVTVIEKGSSNGTTTDMDGRFSLRVRDKKGGALIFSFIGYKRDTVPIANQDYMKIELNEELGQLKEVVINAGYGQMKKDMTTGSVASISGEDLQDLPTTTVVEALQGRIAGLNVLGTSGAPGAQGIITLRGNTSMNPDTRSQPLYVIDGVIMDPEVSGAAQAGLNPLALLNPNDIKSIDVLKDAAAATIYGARGANGVIIVTTKRASSNKPQITVRTEIGMSTRPALRPVMVGAAERRFKMNYLKNNLTNPEQRRLLSLMLTDSLNTAFNNNSDWQDMLIQGALTKEGNVAISGRTETSDFRMSLNYYDEEGVIKNSGFSRMSANLMYNFRPVEKFRINSNVSFTHVGRKQGNGDYLFRFSGWNFPSSFWQITETEREYHTGALEDVRNKNDFFLFNGNLNLQYDFNNHLKFTSNIVGNLNYSREDRFQPGYVAWNGIANATSNSSDNRYYSVENYFNFTTKFNTESHNFNAVIGQSFEEQYSANTYSQGRDIPVTAIKTIQGLPDKNTTTSTYNGERSLASFFTRLSYDYKQKYLISANYRIDGSSRFGRDNRWAYFPSISGGWIITNENFFPESKAFSFVKLRGSYGITGREPGGLYQSYQGLRSDINYYNNIYTQSYGGAGFIVPNYVENVSSPGLSWEQTSQTNLGIELRFLENRISLTGEVYERYTADLLFSRQIPAITGYSNALDNTMDVLNQGWELTLGASIVQNEKFRWRSDLTIAHNENIVAKTPGGRDITSAWFSVSQGGPLYNYKVWETDGVYPRTSDVPVDPLTGERMRQGWSGGNQYEGGDPRRIDQNNDYIIDGNDLVSYGSSDPDLYGGWNNTFNYKGFSLSVQCNFVYGRNILNGYLSDKLNGASNNANNMWGSISGPASDLGDYSFWINPGDDTEYPRIIPNNIDQWNIQSSSFIEDGSFFRVKFINLGYSIPRALSENLGLDRARLWGSVNNVWTYSDSTLLDPEAVAPNGYASAQAYPVPNKFSLGIEVAF